MRISCSRDAARVGELSIDSTPTFLLAKASYNPFAGIRSVGAEAYAALEAVVKEMPAHKRSLQCFR